MPPPDPTDRAVAGDGAVADRETAAPDGTVEINAPATIGGARGIRVTRNRTVLHQQTTAVEK